MAKHNEYFVEPNSKGGWSVKLPHAERVSANVATQRQAIQKAKQFSPEGVVHVKQQNGKFCGIVLGNFGFVGFRCLVVYRVAFRRLVVYCLGFRCLVLYWS